MKKIIVNSLLGLGLSFGVLITLNANEGHSENNDNEKEHTEKVNKNNNSMKCGSGMMEKKIIPKKKEVSGKCGMSHMNTNAGKCGND